MAKGKGRKPAIDLGNRPASAADDFIRDVIRASVKKARTEIPKRAKYRRRDAAKAAMKLREKGKDASRYIKDTASKSAEWNHVNKQSGRIVKAAEKTGDKRLLIAAADIANAPTTADEVLIGAVVHQVITVRTIGQDNIAITYELILRA